MISLSLRFAIEDDHATLPSRQTFSPCPRAASAAVGSSLSRLITSAARRLAEQRQRVSRVVDSIQAALDRGVEHLDCDGKRLGSASALLLKFAILLPTDVHLNLKIYSSRSSNARASCSATVLKPSVNQL